MAIDGAEQRPAANGCLICPTFDSSHWARLGVRSVGDSYLAAHAVLIGFRSAQHDREAVRVLSVRVRRAGFLWEIGQPRIRRTEVRPIFRRRAISDLLMPAR